MFIAGWRRSCSFWGGGKVRQIFYQDFTRPTVGREMLPIDGSTFMNTLPKTTSLKWLATPVITVMSLETRIWHSSFIHDIKLRRTHGPQRQTQVQQQRQNENPFQRFLLASTTSSVCCDWVTVTTGRRCGCGCSISTDVAVELNDG